MNKKVKKGLTIGINVVIWAFLIFAIVMTVLVLVANATRGEGLPSIGGRATVNVLSGSMDPTFSEGDMLSVHTDITDEQKQNLQEGDVISFYFDQNGDGVANEVNTHRIFKRIEGATVRYQTKGDNEVTNHDPDNYYITWSNVLGVWESESLGIKGEKVTGCGSVLSFFQTPVGFMVFVVVPMAAFFIYELVNFVLIIVRMRGEKAAAVRALSEEEIKKRAIEEYLREQEAKKAVDAPVFEENTPADNNSETELTAETEPETAPSETVVEAPAEASVNEPAPAEKNENTESAKKPAAKRTTAKSGVNKPKAGGTVSRVGGTAKKSAPKATEKKPTAGKDEKEDK